MHNSTPNFVSANSLIAKFIRYDASSIASLCVLCARLEFEAKDWRICLQKMLFSYVSNRTKKTFEID